MLPCYALIGLIYHADARCSVFHSKNVKMVKEIPEQDVIVKMNASLFEWVIENLSKNAVDAMEKLSPISTPSISRKTWLQRH